MALYYVINTHIAYTEPLGKLLSSMEAAGVSGNTIVVIAGCSDNVFARSNNNFTIAAMHNSFDYTGAIEVLEHADLIGLQPDDHIFFLQDTMEFMSDTHHRISDYDSSCLCTAVFGGQCNLINCRFSYLLDKRVFIESMKNCSKQDSIIFEGALWKTAPHDKRSHYPDGECLVVGRDQPYSGAPRIKELYTAINLIKWKANYGQTGPRNWILSP